MIMSLVGRPISEFQQPSVKRLARDVDFFPSTFYDLELIHKVAQPSTILPPGIIGIV